MWVLTCLDGSFMGLVRSNNWCSSVDVAENAGAKNRYKARTFFHITTFGTMLSASFGWVFLQATPNQRFAAQYCKFHLYIDSMNFTRISTMLFWSLLIGGGALAYMYQSQQDQKRAELKQEQRVAKAQTAQPSAKTYALDGDQMTVLQTLHPGEFNAAYLNTPTQRCFVWRDASGAGAMACPHRPEYVAD